MVTFMLFLKPKKTVPSNTCKKSSKRKTSQQTSSNIIKTSITSTPLFQKNLGSFNLKTCLCCPIHNFADLILKELLCDLLGLCITITLRDFDHFDTRQSLTLSDEAATGNGYGASVDARWEMVGRIVRWQKQVLRQKEHIEVIDGWYITIHTECVYRYMCMFIYMHVYTLTWCEYMQYMIYIVLFGARVDIPPSHFKTSYKKWGSCIHATAFLQSTMTCNSHIIICPLSSRCYQRYPKHVTWDFCSPKAVELCKWNLDLEVPSCQFHQKRRPADRQNKNRGDTKWKWSDGLASFWVTMEEQKDHPCQNKPLQSKQKNEWKCILRAYLLWIDKIRLTIWNGSTNAINWFLDYVKQETVSWCMLSLSTRSKIGTVKRSKSCTWTWYFPEGWKPTRSVHRF